jgi:hypothetical protein
MKENQRIDWMSWTEGPTTLHPHPHWTVDKPNMDPNKRKELVKAAQRVLQKNLNEEKISFSTGLCPYAIWFT